jgi:hypothetical protein
MPKPKTLRDPQRGHPNFHPAIECGKRWTNQRFPRCVGIFTGRSHERRWYDRSRRVGIYTRRSNERYTYQAVAAALIKSGIIALIWISGKGTWSNVPVDGFLHQAGGLRPLDKFGHIGEPSRVALWNDPPVEVIGQHSRAGEFFCSSEQVLAGRCECVGLPDMQQL